MKARETYLKGGETEAEKRCLFLPCCQQCKVSQRYKLSRRRSSFMNGK